MGIFSIFLALAMDVGPVFGGILARFGAFTPFLIIPIFYLLFFQLKATSKTIMTVNPIMAPIVAISPFPPCWDSGITSSTTTNIIAPAAKAKK